MSFRTRLAAIERHAARAEAASGPDTTTRCPRCSRVHERPQVPPQPSVAEFGRWPAVERIGWLVTWESGCSEDPGAAQC